MDPLDQKNPYNPDQNEVVTTQNLSESPLPTESVGVDGGNKIERIQQSTSDTFENAKEELPTSQNLDSHAIVPYKPEEVKSEETKSLSATAKGILVTTSAAAATGVYGYGVGVGIVEASVGFYTYVMTVPTGASVFAQYFGGYFASSVGVGAGVVAQGSGLAIAINAAPAIIAAGCVLYGGAYLYNRIIADTPEEEISVKMSDVAKPLLITDGK